MLINQLIESIKYNKKKHGLLIECSNVESGNTKLVFLVSHDEQVTVRILSERFDGKLDDNQRIISNEEFKEIFKAMIDLDVQNTKDFELLDGVVDGEIFQIYIKLKNGEENLCALINPAHSKENQIRAIAYTCRKILSKWDI